MNIMLRFIVVPLFLQLFSPYLTASENDTHSKSSNALYGLSPENPVKLGSVIVTEGAELKFNQNLGIYLSRLRGPNGERVESTRLGSCCHTESKNAVYEGVIPLDIYELTHSGNTQPLIIYINMYDYEDPKPPVGLILTEENNHED